MKQIVVTKIMSSIYKGDFAIATAMLDRLTSTRPDWALTLLCRDVARDREMLEQYGAVEPELFAHTETRFSYLSIGTRLFRYLLWYLWRCPWLDHAGKRFVQTVSNANALVFCGGGSPGGYGPANLILHAVAPLMLAKHFQIPVIFAGIGSEPPANNITRILSRWVLDEADLVMARDPQAARAIRLLGVNTELHVTADWAITLPAAPENEIDQLIDGLGLGSEKRIGLNLRDSHSPGPNGVALIDPHGHQMLIEAIGRLIERTGAEVIVVSMNRSGSTDDRAYAETVRSSLPASQQVHMHILQDDYPPSVIKGIISAMDIFIGTRLHPTIFAVSQCVPTLALHPMSKLRGFMDYCGLQDYFYSPSETSSDEIVDAATALLDNRQQVSDIIRDKLPVLHEAVARNVSLMGACIDVYERRPT